MTGIAGSEAIAATAPFRDSGAVDVASPVSAADAGGTSFAQLLADGIDQVNRNLVEADHLVRAFVVDDSVPVHRVTYALEEARLSLELMMQVRSRLVDAYQQIMNMQL